MSYILYVKKFKAKILSMFVDECSTIVGYFVEIYLKIHSRKKPLKPIHVPPPSGLYYGVSICLVTCASALAVLTLNIHHRGVRGNEVPAIIRRIFLGYFSRIVFLHFDLSIDKNWRTASISAARNPVGSGGEGNASGGSITLQGHQHILQLNTAWLDRMSHRKWRKTKQQLS